LSFLSVNTELKLSGNIFETVVIHILNPPERKTAKLRAITIQVQKTIPKRYGFACVPAPDFNKIFAFTALLELKHSAPSGKYPPSNTQPSHARVRASSGSLWLSCKEFSCSPLARMDSFYYLQIVTYKHISAMAFDS
jgi:hypothetical protein